MMADNNARYTVTFPDILMQVLKDRAELNCRSLNKEIIYLLEGALASEIDGNLQIMRMLMAAQGGLQVDETVKPAR